MTERKDGLIYFVIIFLSLLFLKLNFLDIPFFYEERPVVLFDYGEYSLIDLITHNYIKPRFAHHPFSFPLITSVITWIVGKSNFTIHFIMLIYSSLALTFMALCIRKLFPHPRWPHFLGPLLLISFPDYFVHSTNFRFDIFTGFIAILTIYFHQIRKLWFFFIFGIILAYARETVLAFLATFFIIDLFDNFNKKREQLKYLVTDFTLIGVWFSFFLVNYFKYGTFSTSEAKNEINTTLAGYLNIFSFDLKWIFFNDFRFILTGLSVISLILIIKRKEKLPISLLYYFLPLIFFALGMGFHIFEASYYLLPILYGLYILFTYFIYKLNINHKFYLLFIPLSIISFKHLNKVKSQEELRENSTLYLDITKSYQQVINFVNEKIPNAKINAEWPINYYLMDKRNGYTNRSNFNVSLYFDQYWMPDQGSIERHEIDCDKYRSLFEFTIIVEKGNANHRRLQEKYMQSCNYHILTSFNYNSIKSWIYQRK